MVAEIEKILNPEFLLRLVSIQSMKYYTTIDDSTTNTGFTSIVELKVVVIEPTKEEKVLSENIYELELINVSNYQTSFGSTDNRIFEFDIDEVTLVKGRNSQEKYTLKFINFSTIVTITFSDITLKLLTQREFIDGE